MRRPCDLDAALGRETACPEALCPLDENGTCVVAGLRADPGGSPDLARLLVTVRAALGVSPAELAGAFAPGLHD